MTSPLKRVCHEPSITAVPAAIYSQPHSSIEIRHGFRITPSITITGYLGCGGSSDIYEARRIVDERVELLAFKVNIKGAFPLQMVQNERDNLIVLDQMAQRTHKTLADYNILPLLDYFQLTATAVGILMPKYDASLDVAFQVNCTSTASPSTIKEVARRILTCEKFLSDQQLVHCDLKTKNIVVKTTVVGELDALAVIDFSTLITRSDLVQLPKVQGIGTADSRAPEIMLERHPLTSAIDMWGIGCVLTELFTAIPPFWQLYRNIPKQTIEQQETNLSRWVFMHMIRLLDLPPMEMIDPKTEVAKEFYTDNKGLKWTAGAAGSYPLKDFIANARSDLPREETTDFYQFIKRFLTYDPRQRITVEEALDHPYLALDISSSSLPS